MPDLVALTPLDPRYPARLRGSPFAPPLLHWRGGSSDAAAAVAIVGSREATVTATSFARKVSRALARAKVVVLSGGAKGIDAAAHRAALSARGRTWVVAGTGPQHCYPIEHKELFEKIANGPGAVLWPFDCGQRGNFLGRNEVLVALADAVVVAQAGLRSGALHAANAAVRQGKPLWVVPVAPWTKEPTGYAGSMRLLEQGARPLTSVEALLASLPLKRAAGGAAHDASAIKLSSTESKVFGILSNVPMHPDSIAALASLGAPAVSAALLTLALENVVVEGPPGLFRRGSTPVAIGKH